MSIYTRKGDDGTTALSSNVRVSKTDSRIDFLGSIDELSAFMGLLISELIDVHDKTFLTNIQTKLFVLGTVVSDDNDINSISSTDIESLENEIDDISRFLPPLSSFIIPGGTHEASICNVCRAVCRRAERCMWMMSEDFYIADNIRAYLNRLSDYFFILYRKLNFIARLPEKTFHISCK